MDKIKEKITKLREETMVASERAEAAEKKSATHESTIDALDAQLAELHKRFDIESEQLGQVEEELKEFKGTGVVRGGTNGNSESVREGEALARKAAMLEKNLAKVTAEGIEKAAKLEATETKADGLEQRLTQAEAKRDEAERKYEEALAKFQAAKVEVEELVRSMEGM